MNTQRKVVITTTYNEMGIIIDTKAEEVAQPNLQPTCNQLATDTINRQAAIDALRAMQTYKMFAGDDLLLIDQAGAQTELMMLPSAQPEEIALHESCTNCPLYDKDRHYSWADSVDKDTPPSAISGKRRAEMKITITEIEASTDDLMANRRVADAIMDALSRICDAIALPVTEPAWEEEGEEE